MRATFSASVSEGPHVEPDDAGRRLQDEGKRQAQEALQALLETLILDARAGELEGVEEVGQVAEGDEAGVVG
ncbi:MAG TPA: hypothetical protein VFE33_17035 [Thermoanaerobaculia bacterium]|nr:hypothetical protein [Thermoanaerobaculia bacterium]